MTSRGASKPGVELVCRQHSGQTSSMHKRYNLASRAKFQEENIRTTAVTQNMRCIPVHWRFHTSGEARMLHGSGDASCEGFARDLAWK